MVHRKRAGLVAYNGDEVVYESGVVEGRTPVFEINADVDRIVWTPLTSSGKCGPDLQQVQQKTACFLCLRIEIEEDAAVPATGITFDETSVSTLSVGDFGEVFATVTPSNATNPFYHITSDNDEVATVTEIPMGDHYTYLVQGTGVGTATLTATTEDGEHTATWQINVTDELNTDRLMEEIEKVNSLYENLCTEDSWAAVEEAVAAAQALTRDPNTTKADIDNATIAIMNAVDALEFKGSR